MQNLGVMINVVKIVGGGACDSVSPTLQKVGDMSPCQLMTPKMGGRGQQGKKKTPRNFEALLFV